jgi:acyl transferase domain-containing protein/3-hydroxymyristoyl/3-hydroxydecanoyl-(acyl carrier protein) dehydratase
MTYRDSQGRPLVAIVSAAGLFPGSETLDEFWANVVAGRDCSSEAPTGRWIMPPDEAFDPVIGKHDRVYSTRGYYLPRIPLDLDGLAVDAELLRCLDPSVHLAIHIAHQAWDAAITSHLNPNRAGVIFGQIALPTERVSQLAREILEPLFLEGKVGAPTTHPLNRQVAGLPAIMAARALGLGLGGMALDAACASSLYAVKLAVDALQSGRADAMIAGGLSRPDSLYTQMGFAQLRALSVSGRCSPYDAAADGLVVGEGGGAVVLKRLDDAVLAGDDILGVIAGIGLSNDRAGNLLAPASEGQLRAMRAAYRAAGWSPGDVSLIECHATGTPLGDAVEFQSLRELWNGVEGDCVLGAVKATVGHLLTGAGAAGLIKTLLTMRHGIRPPMTNFHRPADGVAIRNSPFRLPVNAEQWHGQHRAAVSAFGFGGINAHVLLGEFVLQSTTVSVPTVPQCEPIAIVGFAVREAEAISEHHVPVGRFPIPPCEFVAMMPQQAMMLLTAAEALDDAGITTLPDPDHTAVFIGCGLDLHTTDFHFRWSRAEQDRDEAGPPLTPDGVLGHLASVTASRIARSFGIGGPSFALSSEVTSGFDALKLAVEQLRHGDISAAIVGAVDTPSDVRVAATSDILHSRDAAVALILERRSDAERAGRVIHGFIDIANVIGESSREMSNAGNTAGAATDLLAVSRALDSVNNCRPKEYWLSNRCDGPRTIIVPVARDPISQSGIVVVECSNDRATASIDPTVFTELKSAARTSLAPSTGKLAFVFPGAGNDYRGMGQSLASEFPWIMERQHAANQWLRDQYAADAFWDGSREPTPADVLMAQVSFGTLVVDILAQLGIRPDAVVGNSLGVSAGLFALRAWVGRDEMLRRLQSSPLFQTELADPYNAVRRAWQTEEPIDWLAAIISAPAEALRNHLGNRAYLLAINSGQECVISGRRNDVKKVASDLGATIVPLNGVTVAHCDIIREVERSYRELHLLPTSHPPGIDFYHPVTHLPFELTRESAADAVLAQALNIVDFPAMIEAAYQDGIRTFVEIGPGASCTRMIGRILAGRPHEAIAAVAHAGGEVAGLIECVRQLTRLGRHIDLSVFNENERALKKTFAVPIRSVPFEVKRRSLDEAQIGSESVSAFAHVADANLAIAKAHGAYLDFTRTADRHFADWLSVQQKQLQNYAHKTLSDMFLDRSQCLAFAVGAIEPILGPAYAEIDSFPTRVRLPDEPLMLVDRIMSVEGEPLSLTHGRVVTEHDVTADRWYLDHGRIPTCIAVEAGQADLFLSGHLGIDLRTRGLAVYRLLDAMVTFHGPLPGPGSVIRYDIHIDRFFRQGDTHLFRFRFEGSVGGQPLLTMSEGCAGFFTESELAAGQGIVQTSLDRRPDPRQLPDDWVELVTLDGEESYSDAQLDYLRSGHLSGCFGTLFANVGLIHPTRLPDGRMRLVHRIKQLAPRGGPYGLGLIRGDADVQPNDWYLTCHFVDDMVMPGTLMYECCLHTLRVFLMRLGWVGENDEVAWEPIPGIASRLKCRGQVIASTKLVTYEVAVKELGYGPEPFALADVLMYADGKAIVEITNMSVRLTGTDRDKLVDLWTVAHVIVDENPLAFQKAEAVYDHDSILAFAIGKPSEAFGEPYRVFDLERVIARLPGPPYQFLDRIVAVNSPPWVMKAGAVIEVEYDVPADAWYFAAYRRQQMPFAVLLEAALQPCGWLAAYMGSALTSNVDLSFRNLGGTATQHCAVTPDIGTLVTKVTATKVSSSGGMIIQHYDFAMTDAYGKPVYDGSTYFGFFSKTALAEQVGIREPAEWNESRVGESFPFPTHAPFPDRQWRMVDHIRSFVPDGGPSGHGYIEGTKRVDPAEWFFKAHFFQDPVMPGSLGLEAFLQLMGVFADRRWGLNPTRQFVAIGKPHQWVYRGQVVPTHGEVTVRAWINTISDENRTLTAGGELAVDGRVIYRMTDFSVQG